MRRLIVSAIVVAALGIWAAPVSAQEQRDPFDPLLSNETSDSGATDTGSTDTSTTDPVTPPAEEPPAESPLPSDDDLPQTGTDPKSWLAVGYVLVAVGATLYALGSRRGGALSA